MRVNDACHVIIHIADPRLLSQLKSYDVACIIRQARGGGGLSSDQTYGNDIMEGVDSDGAVGPDK